MLILNQDDFLLKQHWLVVVQVNLGCFGFVISRPRLNAWGVLY